MLDNLGNLERTHSCGLLRAEDIGKQVVLMGWVAKRRDFGELTFVDLRDRDGITQVVFNAEDAAEAHTKAKELRGEYVIAVSGKSEHTIASFTGRASDEIPGTVFVVSVEELQRADEYEVEPCRRVAVVLQSGTRAWVYVDGRNAPPSFAT